jgi:hypothetical protein
MATAGAIPNPHNGELCPASADGGVGFYSVQTLGVLSYLECPNACGWWREWNTVTGIVSDGSHVYVTGDPDFRPV